MFYIYSIKDVSFKVVFGLETYAFSHFIILARAQVFCRSVSFEYFFNGITSPILGARSFKGSCSSVNWAGRGSV